MLQKKTASLEVSCPDGSLNVADLSAGSPLIGCDQGEALLPETFFSNYEGPNNISSFSLRGAGTASYLQSVWHCAPPAPPPTFSGNVQGRAFD